MEFVLTEYKHCNLLEISGRIDSYTAPNINKILKSIISDGHLNLVVDLKNVTYISSSGILMFVNAQKLLEKQNTGKIHFAGTSDLIYSAFLLAGFQNLFEFYENVTSAMGSF
jgi:anti-sigma B factor antagonist